MEILQEKKLSLFKKYYLEASVIFLALCVITTVRFVINLNERFVNSILEDKQKTTLQVEKSTEAINNNTEVLRDIKEVMRNERVNKTGN